MVVDMRDPADIVAAINAPKPRRMSIEVFRSRAEGRHWYVRLRSSNGQKVTVSEGYTRKASALRAAKRLPAQVAAAEIKVID
jgi:uncharacterized protein YegP (UPF0339 family)